MWSTVLKDDQVSIHRIEQPGPWHGCQKFLSPWLINLKAGSAPVNILIDPGPSSEIPSVACALDELNISNLDWILLTHIHIDHAGGVGLLVKRYPSAKVLVHHRGTRHLANPEKLWLGSLNTLGDLAHLYGEIIPVPENNLVDASSIQGSIHRFSVLDTPGHAPHHLSFLLTANGRRILFAGEAAGVFLPGNGAHDIYMRPATPPKFFFETSMKTLDLLCSSQPGFICCGHYGFSDNAELLLELHKRQLNIWKDIIARHKSQEPEAILSQLLAQDPLLKQLEAFEHNVRDREEYFLRNSIKGFLGFLSNSQQ